MLIVKIILLIVKIILQKRKIILEIVAEDACDGRPAVAKINLSQMKGSECKLFICIFLIYRQIRKRMKG